MQRFDKMRQAKDKAAVEWIRATLTEYVDTFMFDLDLEDIEMAKDDLRRQGYPTTDTNVVLRALSGYVEGFLDNSVEVVYGWCSDVMDEIKRRGYVPYKFVMDLLYVGQYDMVVEVARHELGEHPDLLREFMESFDRYRNEHPHRKR